MAAEEVMDGNVPFTRKLEPVETVPPIRVELAVGKTCSNGVSKQSITFGLSMNKQPWGPRLCFLTRK